MKSEFFNLRETKVLKPITILILLYSALMFFEYTQRFLGIFTIPDNPLIPDYLPYYMAFPSYFVLPFFIIIIFTCVRMMIKRNYNYKTVYILLGLVVLFFLFRWRIQEFLLSQSPYAA